MGTLQRISWRKILLTTGVALLILIDLLLLVVFILLATFSLVPAG